MKRCGSHKDYKAKPESLIQCTCLSYFRYFTYPHIFNVHYLYCLQLCAKDSSSAGQQIPVPTGIPWPLQLLQALFWIDLLLLLSCRLLLWRLANVRRVAAFLIKSYAPLHVAH